MELGKILIVIGLIALVAGGLLLAFPKSLGIFSWFGRLPGDINYQGENTTVFAPFVSMLVLSGVVSGIVWLLQKVLR